MLTNERAQTESLRSELALAQSHAASLSAELRGAQQNLAEQHQLLEDAQTKLRDAFASVSADALAKNSETFLQLARERFAALSAAVELDGSLIEDSLRSSVIVATPTTLIALLKTIEFGWRQEEVTRNAEEIRKHGTELYDRILIFASHFQTVGMSIDTMIDTYNNSVAPLESRLLVTARKIGELGAPSDKEFPEPAPVAARARALTTAAPPE